MPFLLLILPIGTAWLVSASDSGDEAFAWLSLLAGYTVGGVGAAVAVVAARAAADVPGQPGILPPQELPAAPPLLLGRSNEVAEAVTFLRHSPATPRPLVTVSGPPGIGKTALALHVANYVAADYPDGQLFAVLDARGRNPDEVLHRTLARFLRAVGDPAGREPADLSRCVQSFQRVRATKRLLVLLDDVNGVDPRALIPDDMLGATIITSRNRIPSLDPQLPLPLDPLSEEASVDLLGHIVGSGRVEESDRSQAAAKAVVRACAGHPAALQHAGAALVARPSADMSQVVRRTHAAGLEHARPDVKSSAMDFSYELLTRRDQWAVLCLGRLERRFQPWMLAEETDLSEEQARSLADRLSATQFVERSTADAAGIPVYETAEHVQDFARLRAGPGSPPSRGPLERVRNPSDEQRVHMYDLLDRGQLSAANTSVRDALSLARDGDDDVSIALALAALAELRAEVGGTDEVVDLADQAWQQPHDATRARVNRVMAHIQRRVRQLDSAEENLRRAVAYAGRADDTPEKIRILTELALVHRLSGRRNQALEETAEALALSRRRSNGGLRYRPRILLAEGMTLTARKQWDLAAQRYGEARTVARDLDFDLWLSWVDYREAQLWLHAGRPGRAQELATGALAGFTRIRHRYGTGHCRLLLGKVHARTRDFPAARTVLEDALETFRNCGDRFIEGNAAAELANVYLQEGSLPEARDALRRAKQLKTGQRYWRTSLRFAFARTRRLTSGAGVAASAAGDVLPAGTSGAAGL